MSRVHDARREGGIRSLSRTDWKTVLIRTWREQSDDNIGLIAAGVAFYGFLALVPMLGALVLSQGSWPVRRPCCVTCSISPTSCREHLPTGRRATAPCRRWLERKERCRSRTGIGAGAVWRTERSGSILTALNIAYEVGEKRSFVAVNLLTIAMTIAALVFAVLAAAAIAALGHVEDLMPASGDFAVVIVKVMTYLLLMSAGAAAAATLYRFGPSGRRSRWQWLSPGSALFSLGWLGLTLGFGTYVAAFAHYDATYGSLGAVIVLLTWLYLTSYIFLVGAELNSELDKLVAGPTNRE